jgi:polyribonucleotide nucleotidyltransferase
MNSRLFVKASCFVASNEHAAEVIGANGWKIKAIAIKTKTQIKCPSPYDTPIFNITGCQRDVERAKKFIQLWANHFDNMKNKKRNILMEPGDTIDTLLLKSFDVACVIGRKGKQIRKIADLARVKIISPDINKEPIFIISGKALSVELAIFWMKLTTFCSSGISFFNEKELRIVENVLKNCVEFNFYRTTKKIVNLNRLKERFKFFACAESNCKEIRNEVKCNPFYCCFCKKLKLRVAKGLCDHILSCDLCIVDLFRNIYLRCHFCNIKIENFIIGNVHE